MFTVNGRGVGANSLYPNVEWVMTTTDTLVRSIINPKRSDITQFITDANAFIDRILGGKGLTEAQLTTIQTYFTAHLITVEERQPLEDEYGTTRVEFNINENMYLGSSSYGMQACVFDTTGTLTNLGKPQSSLVVV